MKSIFSLIGTLVIKRCFLSDVLFSFIEPLSNYQLDVAACYVWTHMCGHMYCCVMLQHVMCGHMYCCVMLQHVMCGHMYCCVMLQHVMCGHMYCCVMLQHVMCGHMYCCVMLEHVI